MMNHLILAETQFFAMINGKDNGSTETAYGGFVQEVINLCYGGNDAKHIIVALAFAEIELQHHPQNLMDCVSLYKNYSRTRPHSNPTATL